MLGIGDPLRYIVSVEFQAGPDTALAQRVLLYNALVYYILCKKRGVRARPRFQTPFLCTALAAGFFAFVVTATAANWPAWRGPEGNGQCTEHGLPLRWSSQENVRWKVALPGPGNSTPVIWGN